MHGGWIVSRHFRCDVCGLGFTTDTSEVDINRELLNSGIISGSALVSACDTCYEVVMKASRGSDRE